MTAERWARCLVVLLALGVSLGALAARWHGGGRDGLEMHGRMSETGGWTPSVLRATGGQPLHLRLTSDDVMHGFAIGQQSWKPIDVKPGEVSETTLTFDRPGTYTFYCTRWCGPNHWRMRGTIEVSGPAAERATKATPLYVTLGLDPDAPHPARVVPARRPSVARGAAIAALLHAEPLARDAYRRQSPLALWETLRQRAPRTVSDDDVWDLVAWEWRSATAPAVLEEGRTLFVANCAACHGERGGGDGVMAASVARFQPPPGQPGGRRPANFRDVTKMLGASPALLQGKMLRGGMGTGMPYWGPIFTEAQTWALVDFLWTFQFDDARSQQEETWARTNETAR